MKKTLIVTVTVILLMLVATLLFLSHSCDWESGSVVAPVTKPEYPNMEQGPMKTPVPPEKIFSPSAIAGQVEIKKNYRSGDSFEAVDPTDPGTGTLIISRDFAQALTTAPDEIREHILQGSWGTTFAPDDSYMEISFRNAPEMGIAKAQITPVLDEDGSTNELLVRYFLDGRTYRVPNDGNIVVIRSVNGGVK